jgi:hypothetical protein
MSNSERPNLSQRPSIRLRRFPSSLSTADIARNQIHEQNSQNNNGSLQVPGSAGNTGRARALSGPPRFNSTSTQRESTYMPTVAETPGSPTSPSSQHIPPNDLSIPETISEVNKPLPDLPPNVGAADGSQEYESNLVDLLDLIGTARVLLLTRQRLCFYCRSRSSDSIYSHECTKFFIRSRSRSISK